MNSINQNIINNYELKRNDVGFRAVSMPYALPEQQVQISQPVQLPDTYYMPENYKKPKTFKEQLKKVDVMGLIYQWFEHPLLMLGTCGGIYFGVDAFDRSCNKEYNKSVIGKAAKFGDKVEKSKFVQNKNTQKVLGGLKGGWTKFKNFAMKNSVINSMFSTPSQPEWSMPKEEMRNSQHRIVNMWKELAHPLNIMNTGAEMTPLKFKNLAPSSDEVAALKKFYGVDNLAKVNQEELAGRQLLKWAGKTDDEITTLFTHTNPTQAVSDVYKGSLTPEQIEKISKDVSGESLDLVKAHSEKFKDVKLRKGKLFKNKTGFREILNRSKGLSDGAKTATGNFMAKFVQLLHRGFTFGGTKFGVMLFVAPLLVETMVHTKKADKSEKVGTAVQGVINAVSWVFTFPLILKGIHALGGIQYAGMGKDKVDKYRDEITKFNERVKSKDPDKMFKSLAEYNKEKGELKKRLKNLRQVKDQSLLTKTLRGVSRFTKRDLLKIESYRGGSKAGVLARRMPNFFKDAAYAPARFIAFMMIGMPMVDKVITKCTSAIFGKAYDGFKEEELAEAKEKQEEYTMNDLRSRMLEAQKNKLYPPQETAIQDDVQTLHNSSASATPAMKPELPLEQTVNKPAKTETAAAEELKTAEINNQDQISNDIATPETASVSQQIKPIQVQKEKQVIDSPEFNKNVTHDNKNRDNYTYIPSPVNVLTQANPATPINKYIPAQTGIQLSKTFDNSGLDAALKRADRAEKRALSVLAGNFGGTNE